jgi:hypothetical protein
MLNPDCQPTFVPGLSDSKEGRDDRSLNEVGYRRTLVHEGQCGTAGAGLVTGKECLMHSVGRMGQSLPTGRFRRNWRLALMHDGIEVEPSDHVLAVDHLGFEAAASNPTVSGLVVDPNFGRSGAKIKALLGYRRHAKH